MNPRDRLQYALYLQRLHELFVIKENIAFEYPNAHYNKAAKQIDIAVDKCLENNIKAVVDGTHNLESPNLDHVISEALSSQQKMLVKTEDRYIQSAVEQNTKEFTSFIQNRIEKENHSLQAKIQKEYQKKKYNDLSEEEAKNLITEKFKDHARKRSKNIVKDALHTNQSQISWTYNVNNGMKYKVWMNGQSKTGVRSWHIKSKIQPVEIDDFFDIYGPKGHARMMYPGDLNGGAENVANCKCWLHYTNIAPSNLKPRGTIQVNPNVNLTNENKETFSANTETRSKSRKPRVSESTSSNKKEGLFTRISKKISNTRKRIVNLFSKKVETFRRDKTPSNNVKWRNIKKPDLPEELPDNVKDCLIDFESRSDEFTKQKGESGVSYNLTTGQNSGLVTQNDEEGVLLETKSDNPNDILSVSHNHSNGEPPSDTDMLRCVDNTNNVKYVNIHGPEDIFTMESKEKIVDDKILAELFDEFEKCSNDAHLQSFLLNKDLNETMKVNLIKNKKLNKYIEFHWCAK